MASLLPTKPLISSPNTNGGISIFALPTNMQCFHPFASHISTRCPRSNFLNGGGGPIAVNSGGRRCGDNVGNSDSGGGPQRWWEGSCGVKAGNNSASTEPLLLNAIRGEEITRPPVWLMRQAGRYMKSYRNLCEKYPSFRARSENLDLIVEISLQPWKNFKPDGVILFSDILTPLSGMNISFDIIESKGPVVLNPVTTSSDVDQVTEFHPDQSVPYVGQALRALRQEVGDGAAVLGFVGAPFTLASYIVEGGSSRHFTKIKKLAFSQPKILHGLLEKLATAMAKYIEYQADNGAQAVQIFDSWATELSPLDFENLSLPYLKKMVDTVKKTHPELPLILYANGCGGLLERMLQTGIDVMSLDWMVDMAEGRRRLGSEVVVQGNLDPGVLFGPRRLITERVYDIVRKAGNRKHILNLGHGVIVGTPEDNVAHLFDISKGLQYDHIF